MSTDALPDGPTQPATRVAEALRALREMTAEAKEFQQAAGGSVTDTVAAWLAPQFLLAMREKLAATGANGRLEVLWTFLHDRTALRRGDHAAARLQLDREQFDWQRANTQAEKEKEFREWLQRPEIRKELHPENEGGISPETLAKIERAVKIL
jgi:hypothetical protein